MSRMFFAVLAIFAVSLAACRRAPEPKQYQLTGQILAVKPESSEVLVAHDDIKGFMPAMTMPYKVNDAALLGDKQPGDLIAATLVVGEVEAHLSTITKTGYAPLKTPAPIAEPSAILMPAAEVADAPLVNQDGAPSPISSFRGHRVALTFIYTRCPLPEYCPLMNRHFATVQRAITRLPELADVRLVTVTLDPAYDTPAVLKAHAKAFDADPSRWTFLTGEPADVSRFAAQFGVHVEPDAQDATQLIHNLRTAVIDSEGRLVKAESGNTWTPAELVADLKKTAAPAH